MKNCWVAASLVSEGRVIRPPLIPSELTSEDLPDICLRMHLILDSIEFTRCEGRMINRDIFDSIDTLYSDLISHRINHLDDWRGVIERFGEYYNLSGMTMIEVSSRAIRNLSYLIEQLRVELVDE